MFMLCSYLTLTASSMSMCLSRTLTKGYLESAFAANERNLKLETKKFLQRLSVVLTLIGLSACGEEEITPYAFDYSGLEAIDAAIMQKALPAILKECPGLVEHRNRFSAKTVQTYFEPSGSSGIAYPEASKPWKGYYSFDFEVTEGPPVYGQFGFRTGNHLFIHFSLDPLEITSFKPIGAYVCNVRRIEETGGYTARSAPHLAAAFDNR